MCQLLYTGVGMNLCWHHKQHMLKLVDPHGTEHKRWVLRTVDDRAATAAYRFARRMDVGHKDQWLEVDPDLVVVDYEESVLPIRAQRELRAATHCVEGFSQGKRGSAASKIEVRRLSKAATSTVRSLQPETGCRVAHNKVTNPASARAQPQNRSAMASQSVTAPGSRARTASPSSCLPTECVACCDERPVSASGLAQHDMQMHCVYAAHPMEGQVVVRLPVFGSWFLYG